MQEPAGQVAASDSPAGDSPSCDSIGGRESPLNWLGGGLRRSGASVGISFAIHGGLLAAVMLGAIFTSQSPKRAEGIEVTYLPDVFVAASDPPDHLNSWSLADDVIARVNRDSETVAEAMAVSLVPLAQESVGFDHDERVARLVSDGKDRASAQSELMQSALAESESTGQGHRQRLAALAEARKGQFYGIPLGDARKIVYLLDHSGSMKGSLEAVQGHLAETIESLDASKQFHVMYFSSGKPVEMSGKALRTATPARKKLARQFLKPISSGSGTDPGDALARAFSLRPDVIYLLSDGQFSETILDFITQRNPNRRVTVNTVCFGKKGGQDLMKALAQDNGGRFKFIRFIR